MQVSIPAYWVANGFHTTVCTRHGAAATRTPATRFESAPAPWTWATLPLGGVVFLAIRAATRRVVDVPRWAYCDRCGRRRTTLLTAGWVLIGLMVAGFALGIALTTHPEHDVEQFGLDAGQAVGLIVAGLAGWIVLLFSRRAVIARAQVSRDGGEIRVRRAAPEFAAQVEAAMRPQAPAPLPR
ncbi:hypothetical protein [Hamadaea tsunoensis]|uniref:hypothetical protein n=1 Tax=Hamadaea tsunoensis TaxID=53368 RepID=UPI00041C915E|nr:hypothetical protein [Hamadaea tsunoensis]